MDFAPRDAGRLPTTGDDAVGAVLRGLMARFSVEITPREAPSLPPLPTSCPPGRPCTSRSCRTRRGSRPWRPRVRSGRPGCARCRTWRRAPCPTAPRCGACWPTSPRSASRTSWSSPGPSPRRSVSSTRRRRSSTRATSKTPASAASASWGIRRGIPTSTATSCSGRWWRSAASPGSAASTCTSSPSSPSPPSRSSPGSAGSGRWASTCPCTSGCPASPRPPACCGSACGAAWAPR